jgi:ADP-ribose pyrophosphatase YjhB (NUDIX family)
VRLPAARAADGQGVHGSSASGGVGDAFADTAAADGAVARPATQTERAEPFETALDGVTQERRVHLCTGVLRRGGAILMVASRYGNHDRPLWNLPGGRQEPGELFSDAVRREFSEETGLDVRVEGILYVSESYDPTAATHFINLTFAVSSEGEPVQPTGDLHAVECAWVPIEEVSKRVAVRVVREPLCSYLSGEGRTYFGYPDAGITIEFRD